MTSMTGRASASRADQGPAHRTPAHRVSHPISGHDAIPDWLRHLAEAARGSEVAREVRRYQPPGDSGRPSAVLALFGEGASGPDLLFIERAADLRSHAGQPAFPGGAIDPGDAGPVEAALREAAEETGLEADGVDVFATLPELWTGRSGFRVTPVLGWWREPCEVRPGETGEVAAVARIPVAELAAPDNRLMVRAPSGYVGPAFRVAGMLVWGLTGRLTEWLLRLGGWERPWNAARVEDLPG